MEYNNYQMSNINLNYVLSDNQKTFEEGSFLLPYLNKVNETINEDAKTNFLDNLSNLNIVITNAYQERENNIEDIMHYRINENVLFISEEGIDLLKSNPDKTHPKYNEFRAAKAYTLKNLFTMASSKYDSLNEVVYRGIHRTPFPCDDCSHWLINEGITEMLAFSNARDIQKDKSYYFFESLMAEQLKIIVGEEVLLNTYFKNEGIEPLVEVITSYGVSEDRVRTFFKTLQSNTQTRYSNDVQTQIAQAQVDLIYFFYSKIITTYNKDLVMDAVAFENVLINTDLIKSIGDEPRKYFGLHLVEHDYEIMKNDVDELIKTR